MAKGDAYYLRHDNDAFSDPKIIKLRMLHGFEAYALYWRILEMMFDEPEHSLAYTEAIFQVITFDTRTTLDVETVIEAGIDIGLFDIDEEEEVFFSPSLLRRMEDIKAFSEEKSERGRRAAEARWQKKNAHVPSKKAVSNADEMQVHSEGNAERCHEMRRDEMRRDEMKGEEKIQVVEKQASQPPPIYKQVIDLLNVNANTNYRSTTKSHQRLIKARQNEGFELSDFETVILKKTAEWKGGEMERYLRPETLFGTKFESYLNQQEGKQAVRTDSDYDYYAQNPDEENPLDWLS